MPGLPDRSENLRVLILGSTNVHYSKKHGLTNCTGGLVDGTGDLVRLYPIPRVFLDEGSRFRAFQWIEVKATKAADDPRPESYKVDHDSIRACERIPADRHGHPQRRALLLSSRHNCDSLEHLMQRNRDEGISLGIVRPKEILRCRLESRSPREKEEWEATQRAVMAQQELGFDVPLWRLSYIDVRFVIEFTCDDPTCPGHEHRLQDWGIHVLYNRARARNSSGARREVEAAMYERLDLGKYEVFFFFGTFHNHQTNFGLMGSYSCPRSAIRSDAQQSLFAQ